MQLPTIEGNLVNIRRLRRSDVNSIQRNINNRQVSRYLEGVPYPYTNKHAHRWVNSSHRLAKTGTCYFFGIEDRGSGSIVGGVGLNTVNLSDCNAEIGYWLGKRFWGRGFTTEAVRHIVVFSFDTLRLFRVYAFVNEPNRASIRVLEKLGFTHEVTWRQAELIGGRWLDLLCFGLLRDEFHHGR